MLCFYEMVKDKFLGKCGLMNCVGYDKFLFHELYINKTAFVFFLFSQISQLSELLDSPHLDVRMAAGETIALAYELGREHNEDFQRANTPQLADKLRQLATDSHKYRAKKDRKQQRSSFRDILHYVEVSVPLIMLHM